MNEGSEEVLPSLTTKITVSDDYLSFIDSVGKEYVAYKTDPSAHQITTESRQEVRRLLHASDTFKDHNIVKMSKFSDDDEAFDQEFIRYNHGGGANVFTALLSGDRINDMEVKESLSSPIAAGTQVQVDMSYCLNYHKTMLKNGFPKEIKVIKADRPHCIAAKTTTGKVTLGCSNKPDLIFELPDSLALGAPAMGVPLELCSCSEDTRTVVPATSKVKLSELGVGAKGACHRKGTKGADGFDFSGKRAKCGKIYDIFHTPIAVSGASQTEKVMMRAIMNTGSIAAYLNTGGNAAAPFGKIESANTVWSPTSSVGGAHAVNLFGWGEEKEGDAVVKFWWGKNSWGRAWPTKSQDGIFKILRGADAAKIESFGASWINVDPKKMQKRSERPFTQSYYEEEGSPFCNRDIQSERLRSNDEAKKNVCFKIECTPPDKSPPSCTLISKCPASPTETHVKVITDGNLEWLYSFSGNRKIFIRTSRMCVFDLETTEKSSSTDLAKSELAIKDEFDPEIQRVQNFFNSGEE